MSMQELLVEFLDSEVIVYAMYVFLFMLVFYIVYSIMTYFKYYSNAKQHIKELYSRMSNSEKERADKERAERDIHGAGIKRDFLSKVDEKLAYCGLKDKVKWLTTEIYILAIIILMAIAAIVITVKMNFVLGIISAIVVYALSEIILAVVIMMRSKRTESIMLQFMNIVDNFSRTSDDIINIFERSAKYIDEPLASQVRDAVSVAKASGDKMLALYELQEKVKNRHFKVLIQNLEISSRYEANYSDIIEDCRTIFHNYITNEKDKRNIRAQGLGEIGAMLLAGVFCVSILGDLTDTGQSLIAQLLGNGMLGMVIFGYLVFVVIATLYIVVFQILKNKEH